MLFKEYYSIPVNEAGPTTPNRTVGQAIKQGIQGVTNTARTAATGRPTQTDCQQVDANNVFTLPLDDNAEAVIAKFEERVNELKQQSQQPTTTEAVTTAVAKPPSTNIAGTTMDEKIKNLLIKYGDTNPDPDLITYMRKGPAAIIKKLATAFPELQIRQNVQEYSTDKFDEAFNNATELVGGYADKLPAQVLQNINNNPQGFLEDYSSLYPGRISWTPPQQPQQQKQQSQQQELAAKVSILDLDNASKLLINARRQAPPRSVTLGEIAGSQEKHLDRNQILLATLRASNMNEKEFNTLPPSERNRRFEEQKYLLQKQKYGSISSDKLQKTCQQMYKDFVQSGYVLYFTPDNFKRYSEGKLGAAKRIGSSYKKFADWAGKTAPTVRS